MALQKILNYLQLKQKNRLGLYFNDVSWNNASAGDINTKFAKLMKDARTFLRDGDASTLTMPEYISPETEAKYANLDTDVEF